MSFKISPSARRESRARLNLILSLASRETQGARGARPKELNIYQIEHAIDTFLHNKHLVTAHSRWVLKLFGET